MNRRPYCPVWLAWVCLVPVIIGCGAKRSDVPLDEEKARMMKVATYLSAYKAAHGNKTPTRMDEVKAWAKNNRQAEDADFVSTRDGEPYLLLGGPRMLFRENTGKDGQVYVGGLTAGVAVMTVPQAQELVGQQEPSRSRSDGDKERRQRMQRRQ